MVSGKPGSGFEHLAALLVDEFDALQIAVESVADESFHEYVTDCGLCLRNKITSPCRNCPHSLESRSLYQTCRVAAEGVAGSKCFRSHNAQARTKGVGVVIIQGRHIMHEEALCKAASVRIWLDAEGDA